VVTSLGEADVLAHLTPRDVPLTAIDRLADLVMLGDVLSSSLTFSRSAAQEVPREAPLKRASLSPNPHMGD
jgi:hypothetical protein